MKPTIGRGKHMKNFTPEMIELAKSAKSAEDLLEMARKNGMDVTEEEAMTYFGQIHPKSGELDDDDLDNVAGGACYNKDGYRKIVTTGQKCDLFDCGCGAFRSVKFDLSANQCDNCGKIVACSNCVWKVEGGWSSDYCSNLATRK